MFTVLFFLQYCSGQAGTSNVAGAANDDMAPVCSVVGGEVSGQKCKEKQEEQKIKDYNGENTEKSADCIGEGEEFDWPDIWSNTQTN